jgi:hypothetical protein
MIKHKTVQEHVFIPDYIQCDNCKAKYFYEKDDDWLEIEEFLPTDFVGGYKSIFGDGVQCKCDLCQYCVKRLLGHILIQSSSS